MNGSSCARTVTATVMVLLGRPSFAHHSYAMFDRQKSATYAAVVRTWEFNNPHAYLWVYINDASGTPQLWGLEGPGPTTLIHNGWDKDTIKPGDRVTVQINPLLDGRNGGNLIKVTAADGRSLDAGPLPGVGSRSVLNNGPEVPSAPATPPK